MTPRTIYYVKTKGRPEVCEKVAALFALYTNDRVSPHELLHRSYAFAHLSSMNNSYHRVVMGIGSRSKPTDYAYAAIHECVLMDDADEFAAVLDLLHMATT